MRSMLYLLFSLFLLAPLSSKAQSTFIKRYKNTTFPEGSVAVCNLPDNKIAIIGQQSHCFACSAPMIIITDSAGSQIRHFADTGCYACISYDGVADGNGFIYVVGNIFGKAGIIKYDTLGNRIWMKQFYPYGIESIFQTIDIVSDSLIIAGGSEATDNFGGKSVLVGFNNTGDTLWSMHFGYGGTVGFNDITHDSNFIYATGVESDTTPPHISATYLRINFNGQNTFYKKLDNGRKWGYGIIPLSPDTILIGGRADNTDGWGQYSFVSLADSMGNVLHTIEDSNYLFNSVRSIDFDFNDNVLYILDYDTIQNGTSFDGYNHVSVFDCPLNSINQLKWGKTVTGTTATSSRGLAITSDVTILHTATATDGCGSCPYLLKADANTCADLACDTAFVSSIATDEHTLTLKLYPNPVQDDFISYEMAVDIPVYSLEVSCIDLTGRLVAFNHEALSTEIYILRGRLVFNEGLAEGVYVLRFTINDKYNMYGRIVKIK